jgi:hypothetical protein
MLDALDRYYSLIDKHEERTDVKIITEDKLVNLMPCITMKYKDSSGSQKSEKYNINSINMKTNDEVRWIWSTNVNKRNYVKSKQLLHYAVDIDTENIQQGYIKIILTNSTLRKQSLTSEKHFNLFNTLGTALAVLLLKCDYIMLVKHENNGVVDSLFEIK